MDSVKAYVDILCIHKLQYILVYDNLKGVLAGYAFVTKSLKFESIFLKIFEAYLLK